MQELTMQEIDEVSGAGLTIPTFPAGPGLGGGLGTLLASTGYAVGVIGANLGLSLAEILGISLPPPNYS